MIDKIPSRKIYIFFFFPFFFHVGALKRGWIRGEGKGRWDGNRLWKNYDLAV